VYALTCNLAMSSAYEIPTKNGGLDFNARVEHSTYILNQLLIATFYLRSHKTLPTLADCQELLEEQSTNCIEPSSRCTIPTNGSAQSLSTCSNRA
jgi:hypothetical protein